MNSKQMWFHGLAAAFIGGAASALSSGLGLMLVMPDKFNLGPAIATTLKTMCVVSLLTGIQTAAAYLKQSPLWEGTTERRVVSDAQGEKVGTIVTTTAPATEKELEAVHKNGDK